jgi:dihydroxyacetone kinase-like protein
MKKLINDPADVVREALLGLEAAHPDQLRVDHENRVVLRKDAPRSGKVGLVSGGGSGHEPLHGGFVGPGMLDAACAGEVFTSPVPDQMVAATQGVDGGAGVLHIVKNYTGDVLNFEMAAEMVAADSGTEVQTVVVDDDVAVQDSLYTAGRRGVGLTVCWRRSSARRPRRGRPLAEVAELARKVNGHGTQHGHGAHVLHRAVGGWPDVRACRRARWSWASASTASPAGSGCPWHRPRTSRRCWSTRCSATCRTARATR